MRKYIVPIYIHICYILFIHSSVTEHLGCFHVLTIVKRAAMNTDGYMYLFKFQYCLDICLGVGLQGHMVTLFQFFKFQFVKEPSYCFPQKVHQFTFPVTVQENFLLSTSSPAFIICSLLNDGHSDWHEFISHYSLDFYFSNSWKCLASLLVPIICMSSLEKCLLQFSSVQLLSCV